MPFSEDLWDGFEKVIAKITLNTQTCKDYYDFFGYRAKYEKSYADNLQSICKVHPGGRNPVVDKQEKTLKEALLSITESGARMAAKHLDAATQMTNGIIKPLEAFIKQAETEKKRLTNDGQGKIKIHTEAVNAAHKAHDYYLKLSREFESAKDAHIKTEAELKAAPEAKKARIQGNLAKAATKRQQCQENATKAENAYKTAVQASNDIQKKLYGELLPATLAELQKLAEDQFRTLEKVLKTYLDIQKGFPEELSATIELMQARAVTDLSWDNDLQEFITATKTNVTGPTPLEFIPFQGKPDPTPAPAATTSTSTTATTTAPTEPAKQPEPAPAATTTTATTEPAATTVTSPPAATEPAPTTTVTSPTKESEPATDSKTTGTDPLSDISGEPKEKKESDPVDNLFS